MRFRFVLAALLICAHATGRTQSTDAPSVHVGGYVQFDYLAPLGERTEGDQTFRFRRVRLALSGALVEHIDWMVTIEATTTPMLRDAYIALKHVPAATVRLGQFVMPHGLEQYVISSNSLEFTERLLTPLVSNRDAGVMVTNTRPFGGWLTYAVAVTNGTGMNVRDDNDAKDAVVRVTATPPAIRGLQISVNGARGEQVAGMRTRRGADISLERRAYHLAAEFEAERIDTVTRRHGFYMLGSWRLYPSAPRRLFDHVEFGSRYGRITGGEPFGQWEIGANYYLQPAVRLMCDYIVHTDRAAGAPRHTLHARANFRF